ncbi:MAG: ATP-binding cassette domain-containing protein [Xanthomonadales bacterium]|nr:ATP-binding cassette domain-containing protein [Gammaproteobacteria bacterium]MBT8057082.1 ATP-binding cassette domain-containing protein [Gammaproteobacteria bacterium]NNJ79384.1 ATP-binding cassette domain-containing protein [Xanthomonadales bacterium]NNK52847.1 ATP-binding cassette domain-containing protein [Xanthomonadales bacterium]
MQTDAASDSAREDTIIRIRDLVFRRGRKTILDGISLDIQRGSIVAFMGPSGAGKTTVLRLISGQLQPDEGSIEIDGEMVSDMSRAELYRFRRNIGVLLQDGALFTDLTVFENIATPIREHTDLPEPLVRRLVMSKLNAVGLGGIEERMPHELSGGQARRVAFARAVVLDPSLMLYDEPTTGLDPIAVSTVRTLMRETNDVLGLTSLVVTHNVDQVDRLADYAIIISGGKIAGKGSPQSLHDSTDPGVDQFMNGKVEGPIPFHYQPQGHDWNLLN